MSSRADKIRKHLVIDESKLLDDSLERLRRVIALSKDGGVHFVADKRTFSDRQLIALYLIGKRFAYEAGLVKEQSIAMSQIAKDLRLEYGIVAARLADLRSAGLVDSPQRGKYSATAFAAEAILSDIESPTPLTSDEGASVAGIPVIKPTKKTVENIKQLFETTWGRTPRSASEVTKALEVNAALDPQENVAVYLRRLANSGKLSLFEKEGKFRYARPPS
ncbi:MAG: hypothetical protein WB661_09435 [Candidatus Bathyarchaeia archaeon]